MTEDRNQYHIPTESWKRYDDAISRIATSKEFDLALDPPRFRILEELGFKEENGASLTEIGKEYYRLKYILDDPAKANAKLAQQVKKHPITKAICQLSWGKKGIKRRNIYNLLLFENIIKRQVQDGLSKRPLKEEDLGAFLMLLNQCRIIRYSKRNQEITILYNPKSEDKQLQDNFFISPETPYSNTLNLKLLLRQCNRYIYWIDKHFGQKGLEPLAEEADANKIKTIKILTGIGSNITDRLKRDFERFHEEMINRDIDTELRVIAEKEVLQQIHGRWIISEHICYNVPPINSIFQNQYDEMKKTTNIPPFSEWWKLGLSITTDFDKIMQASKKDNQHS